MQNCGMHVEVIGAVVQDQCCETVADERDRGDGGHRRTVHLTGVADPPGRFDASTPVTARIMAALACAARMVAR